MTKSEGRMRALISTHVEGADVCRAGVVIVGVVIVIVGVVIVGVVTVGVVVVVIGVVVVVGQVVMLMASGIQNFIMSLINVTLKNIKKHAFRQCPFYCSATTAYYSKFINE